MRVTTSLFVSALLRRVQSEGAFATIVHKGNDTAGAVFIIVSNMQGRAHLLGPALQIHYDQNDFERRFETLLSNGDDPAVYERIQRERKFDPDIWVVEIEDREMRPFVDLVPNEPHR